MPVMFLNGQKYNFAAVLKVGKTGPEISPKFDEINPFEGDKVNPEHVVSFDVKPDKIEFNGVLYFKQHGKLTVLVGHESVAAGKLHGRLLSTPAFKTARIVEQQKQEVTPPPTTYPDTFANTPRIKTGYQGNSLRTGVVKRFN